MATIKQKKAVDRIVVNHGNLAKSMREAGYAENTVKNPSNLTNSDGFEELCKKAGLTDQFLLDALTEDIILKPQNRKGELELGIKVKGLITEKRDITSGGKSLVVSEDTRKTIGDRLKNLL